MTQLYRAWWDGIRMTDAISWIACNTYVTQTSVPGERWEIHPAEWGMHVTGRTEKQVWVPTEPGRGTSTVWRLNVCGVPYIFTEIKMPDGEWRMSVYKYNGYRGGPKFACAWTRVHQWIVPPEACDFCGSTKEPCDCDWHRRTMIPDLDLQDN
jgi:hypothetical protein